ncbi:hypothetical protein MJO29_003177 [Puccinia striiformis f. sp. tritici]|nr:hypothetical protein MJO29_003177 [Puccinia striiformis f. sp. tritici]
MAATIIKFKGHQAEYLSVLPLDEQQESDSRNLTYKRNYQCIQAMYSTQRVLVDEKLSLLISELPTRFSWVMDDKSNKYDLEATCDAAQLFLNVLNEKSNKHEAIQLGCCKVNVA